MDRQNGQCAEIQEIFTLAKIAESEFLGIVNIGQYGTVFPGLLLTFMQLQPSFDQEVTGSWDWRKDTSVPLKRIFLHISYPAVSDILTPRRPVYPVKFSVVRSIEFRVSEAQNTPKGECGPSAAGRDGQIRASRPTGRIASLFWSAARLRRPEFNERLFFDSSYAKYHFNTVPLKH